MSRSVRRRLRRAIGFACVLLGTLAFVIGADLIVFSPVPVDRECRFRPLIAALDGAPPGLFGYHPSWARYYYRTWPPGVAVAVAGLALIVVGISLRCRRPGTPAVVRGCAMSALLSVGQL